MLRSVPVYSYVVDLSNRENIMLELFRHFIIVKLHAK